MKRREPGSPGPAPRLCGGRWNSFRTEVQSGLTCRATAFPVLIYPLIIIFIRAAENPPRDDVPIRRVSVQTHLLSEVKSIVLMSMG